MNHKRWSSCNQRPSDSQAQIAINDNLPDGLTYISADTTGAPGFICAAGPNPGPLGPPSPGFADFHCTLNTGSLAAGSQVNIVLTARVEPTAASGVLTNQAVFAREQPVTRSAATIAPPPVSPCSVADLAIVKTSTAGCQRGQRDHLQSDGTNNGPSTANAGEVTVNDSTPTGTTLRPDRSAAQNAFSSCGSFPCNSNGAMAPGDTATITFKVKVDANFAPQPGFVTNTATVAVSEGAQAGLVDGNPTNNSSTVQTAVGPNADLQLTKTATPASVVAGDPSSIITYTITYQNAGPGDANAVRSPMWCRQTCWRWGRSTPAVS
ncbi:MAG: hypothetical protein IPG76_08920 [Acidobacteria bacterium]|nr:hypothetical protein [Acidobacteriota bacterium]